MYSVLLVDDEILIREAISQNTKWNELGFELAGTCRDGREAMEYLKSRPIDLVLTDIYMPYVDGMELTKHIYENYKNTRVVIISGYDEFEYAKKALKYQVVEYILKPVTAMELSEILQTVRRSLDEERRHADSLKKIRSEYMANLPVLRGRFLHSLLRGNTAMPEEEIKKKMEDYDIFFSGPSFLAAMIQVDDLSGFSDIHQKGGEDLVLFAIYNISDEIVREASLGTAFQDEENRTVLVLSGKENFEKEALALCRRIQEAVMKFLNVSISMGVGYIVSSIFQLPKSCSSARAALEYRFSLGGSRVIYAEDLNQEKGPQMIDAGYWSNRIMSGIRRNSGGEIRQEINGFIQAIRDSYVSRNRSIFYIQNAILSIMKEIDASGMDVSRSVEEERILLNEIYEKEHLSEIAQALLHFCIKLSDDMGDQKESFGKRQTVMALDYIEKNYADSTVSLNSVCSYLAMSTSYFSSVFKTYTGETFIEALTKKRIEKAKLLLQNTSKRTYEIAREVGYADPHYFSTIFKKVTGLTPKEYSKENRK